MKKKKEHMTQIICMTINLTWNKDLNDYKKPRFLHVNKSTITTTSSIVRNPKFATKCA